MVIKQKHLIEFQIYYLLVADVLIELLHFPDIIRYILDANIVLLILLTVPKIRIILSDKYFKGFNGYVLFYMAFFAVFSLFRSTPVGQVLWAVRNNYFYIFFMFVCAYSLKPEDIRRILNNVLKLQVLNVACVLYEYFVLHKFGDYVGGLFGISKGCNGSLNIYLVVITAYVLAEFLSKKASVMKLVWILVSCIGIAAISELKFYFIELVLIVALFAVLSGASFKNVVTIAVAAVCVFAGLKILSTVSPWSANMLKSIHLSTDYASSTQGDRIISRAHPFKDVNRFFFGDNSYHKLLGYGLGACEDSEAFAWANSTFATHYRSTQYRNLSTSDRYLETGYIGFVGLILIFVLFFIVAQKQKQKNPDNRYIFFFSQTLSVLVILNFWYNCAIRKPIAYLTFFALSSLIVYTRDKRITDNNPKEEKPGRIKIRVKRKVKFKL